MKAMERYELERMLLDPDALKKLTEMAKELEEKHGRIEATSNRSASRVRPVEIRPYEMRPTTDEIRANDRNYAVTSATNRNVARFLTASRETDPLSLVKLAAQMCKDEASDANRLYLEVAINQVSSEQALDEKGKRIVKEAIQVLISTDAPEKKERKQYEHRD
jgi:hypothetical protein